MEANIRVRLNLKDDNETVSRVPDFQGLEHHRTRFVHAENDETIWTFDSCSGSWAQRHVLELHGQTTIITCLSVPKVGREGATQK